MTVGAGVALLPVDGVACAGELGVAAGADAALGTGGFAVTAGAGEALLPVDGRLVQVDWLQVRKKIVWKAQQCRAPATGGLTVPRRRIWCR